MVVVMGPSGMFSHDYNYNCKYDCGEGSGGVIRQFYDIIGGKLLDY